MRIIDWQQLIYFFLKKEDSYEKEMFTHDIEVSATNLGGVLDTCLSPAICLCFSKSARGWWTGHMWNRHNGFVLHSCSPHVPIFTVLLFQGKQVESTRLHQPKRHSVFTGYSEIMGLAGVLILAASQSMHLSLFLSKYGSMQWVSTLRDFGRGWGKIEVRVVSWNGTKPGKVATSLFFLLLSP